MASQSIHKTAKAVAPVRLGEQVAQLLLRRIRLGEYLPGNRLPSERELCEELGVSRTVLREGLHWLEYQKYVEILRGQHGGAVVLPTTPEVAWERSWWSCSNTGCWSSRMRRNWPLAGLGPASWTGLRHCTSGN
jgi:DNA-binding transcriptional MocR family regulator